MAKATNNYASRVKALQNEGSEVNINSFGEKVLTSLNDQKDALTKEVKTLEVKIKETIQCKHEFCLKINPDDIDTVDNRNDFAESFANRLENYDNNKVIPLQNQLTAAKAKIELVKASAKFFNEASVDGMRK